MYSNTTNPTPTANITVNKSRLKIHDKKNIYLKDGDNFEFELFNPTTKVILATINIDGKSISASGVVLNPGQRIFLERYFDTPRKFKFSTYKVEAGNSEVEAAISQNGLIQVKFYDEVETPKPNFQVYDYNYNFGNSSFYSGILTNSNSIIGTNTTSNTYYSSSVPTSIYSSPTSFTSFSNPKEHGVISNTRRISKSIEPEMKETGRIEAGPSSTQSFGRSNKIFASYPSITVTYKLLPQSQETVTQEKKIKNFCSNCGFKLKGKNNFCPNCGNSLD